MRIISANENGYVFVTAPALRKAIHVKPSRGYPWETREREWPLYTGAEKAHVDDVGRRFDAARKPAAGH
jgi:hypothetical protein